MIHKATPEEAFNQPDWVLAAIRRGARQAVEDHRRSGEPMVAWRDGRVVRVPPEELPEPEAETAPSA